jgi:hypothetical protein
LGPAFFGVKLIICITFPCKLGEAGFKIQLWGDMDALHNIKNKTVDTQKCLLKAHIMRITSTVSSVNSVVILTMTSCVLSSSVSHHNNKEVCLFIVHIKNIFS